jgi:hypothetical protein
MLFLNSMSSRPTQERISRFARNDNTVRLFETVRWGCTDERRGVLVRSRGEFHKMEFADPLRLKD